MRNNKRFLRKTLCTLLGSLSFGLALPMAPAFAAPITVIANAPQVVSSSVAIGETRAEVELSLQGVNNLRLQVIAPVAGVALSLLEPSGNVYLPPHDPGVTFLDGALLSPPLPGGVFITPNIASPQDGLWKLRLDFPAATEPTVVMTTVYTQTPYQTAMVLDSNEYPLNQTASVGMLVLNGTQPVTGLSPVIQIQPPNGAPATFAGLDDGDPSHLDGMAGDGIYSGPYTFNETGLYTITGQVSIPTPNGPVERTATATVTVRQPSIAATNIQGVVTRGTNNCVSRLDVRVDAQADQAATYVASGRLRGISGQSMEKTTNQVASTPQAVSFLLSYSSQDIRDKIAADGPYTVSQLDLLSFTPEGAFLEVRELDALTFSNITLADLCRSAIEIGESLNVGQTLRSGYIDGLTMGFPVYVAASGTYQISLKVTDRSRQDVHQYGFSQYLTAGDNTVTVTLPHDFVQTRDGAYSVESVLITGLGASAQASLVGSSDSLSRWQFYPTIKGDLDGDGDVDTADRDLLMAYRNQPALSPGDRRDLNRDGKIDLKDARTIATLLCGQGSCPTN